MVLGDSLAADVTFVSDACDGLDGDYACPPMADFTATPAEEAS